MSSTKTPSPAREIVSGLGLCEGPTWTRDGRLVVTSVSRGVLYEIDVNHRTSAVLVETGGGPNGLAEDDDGVLWIAQNGGAIFRSRSNRVTPAGIQRFANDTLTDIVAGYDKPNDCVIAPDGRLWFTDPRGSARDDSPRPGRVCALDRQTREVEVMFDGPLFPNGLAFGLDPDEFYLAETARSRILRSRRTAEGWMHLTPFSDVQGHPDGMAFDSEGRLYVVTNGEVVQVVVLDPMGRPVEQLPFEEGDLATNVCFGGPDLATAFITVAKGGRVMAIDVTIPGK